MKAKLTRHASSDIAVVGAVSGLLTVYGGRSAAGPKERVVAPVRNSQLNGVSCVNYGLFNNKLFTIFDFRKLSTI